MEFEKFMSSKGYSKRAIKELQEYIDLAGRYTLKANIGLCSVVTAVTIGDLKVKAESVPTTLNNKASWEYVVPETEDYFLSENLHLVAEPIEPPKVEVAEEQLVPEIELVENESAEVFETNLEVEVIQQEEDVTAEELAAAMDRGELVPDDLEFFYDKESFADDSAIENPANNSNNELAQKVAGIEPVIKTFNASAYCSCEKCCGKTDGITASGNKVAAWHTIAAGKHYPLGTVIYVPSMADKPNGGWFVVEDRGSAISDEKIDIYFDSHSEAKNYGRDENLEAYVYYMPQ